MTEEKNDKKYGIVYEDHNDESDIILENNDPILIEDDERIISKDESKPWNFIIEGDNLHALQLLEKTHKGKIDLIYIDPPYNTGAKDWKYNNKYLGNGDMYRHSKWLSMMGKRLKIASRLLKPSGVIVCAIDDYEVFQLGMLMDEIFDEDNRLGVVSVVHNPEGRNQAKFFGTSNEFALFYAKNKAFANFNSVVLDGDLLATYDRKDAKGIFKANNYIRAGGGYHDSRENKPNFWYPIYVSPDLKDISLNEKEGYYKVLPVSKTGRERTWKTIKETFEERLKDGEIFAEKDTIGSVQIYRRHREKQVMKTHWIDKKYHAFHHGTKILTDILGQGVFDFPKSLYLIKDILKLTLPEDGIVLDFFAGSGTTGHAVNLLNAEDNGNRKFIMVTNNEISEKESKEFTERGLKKGDPEWEARGIAKYVTWPRTACSIEGVDINGEPLKGEYLGSNIAKSQGFISNVKYLKVGFVPKD